jgi:uncharacterized protein (DUF302 family)
MSYYFSTHLTGSFADVLQRTREVLQAEGFGIISEIDIQKALSEKIGVEFRRYTILGACNPALAYEALRLEDKVGTMLPCNVVVQEVEAGIEVAAIDPVASMRAIQNANLSYKAAIVAAKLRSAIERLGGSPLTEAEEHRIEIEREAELSRTELEQVPPPGADPFHEGP